MTCPNCGEECACDMVDVGGGEIQSGPYGCENCGWVQASKPEGLVDDDEGCQTCGGSGELPHDCGDDTCCCLDKDGPICPTCLGTG